PISSGAVPNTLLNTTRTRLPPMLVRTICRTVWFVSVVRGDDPPRTPPGAAGAGPVPAVGGGGPPGPSGGGVAAGAAAGACGAAGAAPLPPGAPLCPGPAT